MIRLSFLRQTSPIQHALILCVLAVGFSSMAWAQDPPTGPEIKGPADGATLTFGPEDNTLVLYGSTEPFSPVEIFLDDTNINSATADGKGAWNFNLSVGEDDAGEHTFRVVDRNDNATEITVTLVWDENQGKDDGNGDDNEGDGNDDERLEGKDPEVASTGGRAGSCTTISTTPASTGLVVLSWLAALAWMRRRRDIPA